MSIALGICTSESNFLICIIALPGKIPVLRSVLSKEFAITKFCFQRKQQSTEVFHLFPFRSPHWHKVIRILTWIIWLSLICEVYIDLWGVWWSCRPKCSASWLCVSPEEKGVWLCLMFLCIQVSIYPYSYIDIYLLYIGLSL